MKIEDIRTLARAKGLKPGKLNKTQLIHSIQRHEGNFDCFGSAVNGDCDQQACGWREDCLPAATKKPATAKKSAPKKKTVTSKTPVTRVNPETKKPATTKKKTVKKKK